MASKRPDHESGKGVFSRTVGATVHHVGSKRRVAQTVATTIIHNTDCRFGVLEMIGGIVLHSGPLFDGCGQGCETPLISREKARSPAPRCCLTRARRRLRCALSAGGLDLKFSW